MNQTIAALVAVLVVALTAALIWVSIARKKQIQAETATKALKGAKEVQHAGNKVMAEPVADELAWLAAARQRLRDDRDRS